MNNSTKKFLAILLSLAMLLSFPMVASAATTKNYEATFKGTYTAPEDARNVLVSGTSAKISEWYGDRVNMGGRTFTVCQNEYGINKHGNAVKLNVGDTHTLWIAQYGVATLVFTAPQSGQYALYTSDAGYEHSPSYMFIRTYEKQNSKYSLRTFEYGCFSRQYNKEYGCSIPQSDEMAYTVLYMEAGETIYITASTGNDKRGRNPEFDKDWVFNLSVEEWTPENCKHKFFANAWIGEPKPNCTRDMSYICSLCKAEEIKTEEYHDYIEDKRLVDASTCEYIVYEKCANCGEIIDQYTDFHNMIWDDETNFWTCINCGLQYSDVYDDEDYYPEKYIDAGVINLGDDKAVDITVGNQIYCYDFIPENTGVYTFSSSGDYDTRCLIEVYDVEEGEYIWFAEGDDYGDSYNFHLQESFEAGHRYKIFVRMYYSDETGSFEVSLKSSTIGDADSTGRTSAYSEVDYEEDDDYWEFDGHRYAFVNEERTGISSDCSCAKNLYYYSCIDCGKEYVEIYYSHNGKAEFVQKTPQIGAEKKCGSYNLKCSACGKDWYENDIVLHSYHAVNENNKVVISCYRCDKFFDEYGREIEEEHKHVFEQTTKNEPTCSEDGVIIRECACGEKETEVLPATGNHTGAPAVKENIVEATIHSEGSYDEVVYCAVCKKEMSRTPKTTSKVPHTHSYVKTVTTPATCIESGVAKYTCSCGDSYTEDIPKEEHNIVKKETNRIEPTCAKDGSYVRETYCTKCLNGSVETITIPATGNHTGAPAVKENIVEATIHSEGSYDEVVYCAVCKKEMSRTPKTTSKVPHTHSYVKIEEVSATCVASGYIKYACSECGIINNEILPATGVHSYNKNVVAPTCTSVGYTVYTCSVCKNTYKADEVPAVAHTIVVDSAVEATETATGLTEGKHCSVCNTVIVAQDVTPVLVPMLEGKTQEIDADVVTETTTVICRSAAPFDEFIRVTLDGEVVDPVNYDVYEGSIVVKLKPNFVKTLANGAHVLGIDSKRGTSKAVVTVKRSTSSTNITPNHSPNTGTGSSTTPHVHNWNSQKVIKNATFKKTGLMAYVCSCGAENQVSIPVLKVTTAFKQKNAVAIGKAFSVSTNAKSKTVLAKWSKVPEADGYMIYAAYNTSSSKPVLVATKGSKTTSYSFKKIGKSAVDMNKNIKVYVVAYAKVNGKKVEIAKTQTAYVCGAKNAKATDPTKISVKSAKVTIKKNKTSKISTKVTYKDAKKARVGGAAEVRYVTSDKSIATVDKNGKIKGIKKGSCTILVVAKNGIATSVKVTVK